MEMSCFIKDTVSLLEVDKTLPACIAFKNLFFHEVCQSFGNSSRFNSKSLEPNSFLKRTRRE